jgi:hypothetical protein
MTESRAAQHQSGAQHSFNAKGKQVLCYFNEYWRTDSYWTVMAVKRLDVKTHVHGTRLLQLLCVAHWRCDDMHRWSHAQNVTFPFRELLQAETELEKFVILAKNLSATNYIYVLYP